MIGGMVDVPPGLEEIRLHDTRTRETRPFVPLVEGKVGIYTCGPTVYAPQTLGNMRSQLFPDLLRRVLAAAGYDVTYVTNITDVGHLVSDADDGDDKMEKAAAASGETAADIAARYTEQWADDRRRLGCLEPDVLPRAADHIAEQIAMVETLEAQGHTYVIDDGVYFDVTTFPRYSEFADLRLDDLESTGRIEGIAEKRNPADFALWKRAEPAHILRWNSPWGWGFPGWHLECSAMGSKYLGQPFDIHGGGLENQFPHHESEIAQSQAAHGEPLARYWLHNNMVTVGGQKMGKSLGNAIFLKDLFRRYDPLVVRYFILNSHYRSPLDFTDEALSAAERGLARLHNSVRALRRALGRGSDGPVSPEVQRTVDEARAAFSSAMDDDFNTAAALAALFDLARAANTFLSAGGFTGADVEALERAFRELGGAVLGIVPDELPDEAVAGLEEDLIHLLIELRREFRANRQWQEADAIRDRLAALGVQLEDKPEGTTYRLEAAL